MTPETVSTGYLMIGLSLLVLGALVIAVVRSERAEGRACPPTCPVPLYTQPEFDAETMALVTGLRFLDDAQGVPVQRRAGEGS